MTFAVGQFLAHCEALGPLGVGEPVDLVRSGGPTRTSAPGASRLKSIVHVHDADRAKIYELVEQR